MYKTWFNMIEKKKLILPCILSLFISANNFFVSFSLQQIVEGALHNQQIKLVLFGSWMIIAALLYGVAYYFLELLNARIEASVSLRLKQRYLEIYFSQPLLDLEKEKNNHVFVKLEKDIMNYSALFTKGVLPTISLVLTIIIGGIYTIFFSWQIFTICMVVLPVIFLLNNTLANKVIPYAHSIQEIEGEETKWYNDIFQSKAILNVFNAQHFLNLKMKSMVNRRLSNSVKKEKINTINHIINDSGILAIECSIFFVGMPLIAGGYLSVGAFIGIWNAAIGSFIWPIVDLPDTLSGLKEKKVAYGRIKDIIMSEEIKESEELSCQNITMHEHENALTISQGYFAYTENKQEEDKKYILKNIDFHITSQGITLIKGESGAGKTTLIKVLLGLYPLESGNIMMNDTEINDMYLKEYIGYVPQKESLLPLTLKENLCLGKEFCDEQLTKICKIVGLDKWLSELPNGLDTKFSKETMLSVGQSARIAIMRALLHQKKFIILDEPFAGLDEDTISQISKLLKEISRTIGIIIVSHRKSTEGIADTVYTLKGGDLYVS